MNKLQPYDSYQSAELNFSTQIPKDWNILRAKFILKEINERSLDGTERLLSVSEHKGVVPRDSINVNMFQAENYTGYKMCNPGDVVINSLWAWHRGIGVAEHRGIVSTAYSVHRLKKPKEWNHRYLTYLLRTSAYVGEYLIRSKGIWESRLQLTASNFLDVPIIIPPLETQNAIVVYLDRKTQKIQEFIRKKGRLIELLEEEKNYIINKAVTKGINSKCKLTKSKYEWIDQSPFHWSVLRLRFLGYCQNGISAEGDKFGKGLPFVSYSDVYKNSALPSQVDGLMDSTNKERENYSVLSGDVFFTRTSETIEEIGFASTCLTTIKEAVFSGFLIRFRPKKNLLSPRFSKFYFRSIIHRAYFVKEVDLVTRVSLGQDLLKSLPVLLPPMDEQEEIAKFIEKELNKRVVLVTKAQSEIEKAKEYQDSLITQIVTGQLKVPACNPDVTKRQNINAKPLTIST